MTGPTASTVAPRARPTATPWLWDLRPAAGAAANPVATVLILPHAGGSASAFLEWGRHFPAGVAVLAAQYPGRGPRIQEPEATCVEDIVDPLADAAARLTGRLVVLGHSFGAVIGLELCHALACRSRPVDALVASSARAPDAPSLFGSVSAIPRGAELARQLHRWGALPDTVLAHAELLDLAMPAVRADLVALERYVRAARAPRPPLDCPITVIAGRNDPLVPMMHLSGWSRLSVAAPERHLLPCGHFPAGADLDRATAVVGALAVPAPRRENP